MAGDGASIGEVYVDILPKDDGFWAKFVAQNHTQAKKIGDELGGVIGKSIADHIAKGIRDGLGGGTKGSPAREPGRKGGEDFAGEFGRVVKTRIEAALRSLPKAKLGVDAGEAERKIAELRAQLADLSSKRVGVDLSATEMLAELDRIKIALDEVGAKHPNPQVRVDSARAMTELAAVQAQIDRIDGQTATVTVDDSGVQAVGAAASQSTGSVSALAAAGTLLGPALVPGAAAAVQAIAGITPMALGAAGALAVVGLSLSGVVGAVKAMGAANDAAGQTALSLASRQTALAGAVDQVRSAQASLANTTANAADSQRRASQTIVSAELSEAAAHRTLLQAQQAITQARIDAARAAEDLSSRVAHNALDQRQAALDTAQAEQALAAARANAAAQPGSPVAVQGLTEAQLAFDQQTQRNADLIRDGQRLTDEKTKGDKAGIDGSTQVVTALERVRAATEAVHKAEQATADARIAYATQARQSAASIAQAQQGVVNAQRAVQQASAQAGAAGSAAMTKLAQSMAELSPEGQRFALFIYGLRAPLLDLRRTAEAGFLPGAQAGIEGLMPLLPTITTSIGAMAREAGHLATQAGVAFGGAYWRDFITFMTGQAVPALDTGARVAYNFALGLSGLVRAFLPLGQDVGGGLLKFSEQFAAHALTLQNTAGYRSFLDYVRVQGPIVAHTIGEVVTAAVRLVVAIGPLGGVSLTIIRLLAQTINALPIGVLTVLAGGIGAVVVATKVWAVANGLLFSSFGIAFVQMIVNARIAMALAATEGAGRLATSLSGVRAAAGTLASTIGVGGALGIAVGAGVLLLALFANAHQKAAEKAAQQKRGVEELTDAIKQNSGAIDANVRKIAAKQAYDDGALDAAKKAGVSVGLVTDAYIQGSGAIGDIISQQESYIETEQKAAATDQEHQTTHLTNVKNSRDLIAVLQGRQKASNANETATRAMAEADRAATGAAFEQTPAQKALGDALNKLADSKATAADKADALRRADEAVFGGMRAAITTADAAAASQDRLTQMFKAYTDEHGRNTAAFVSNTEAGRQNRTALEERLTAINNVFFADVQAGVAIDEATKKHDTNRDAALGAAKAIATDKGEVDKLGLAFGTLPTDPKVIVSVSGVAEVMGQLETAQIAQFGLMRGLSPQEAEKQWREAKQDLRRESRRAQGGPIFGPGTTTSDSIPAIGPGGARYRLSNDEHIVTAAEVKAAGGHGAIMQWRKWLLDGASPQVPYPGDGSGGIAFATGGPVPRPRTQPPSSVKWPFPVDVSKTRIPKAFDFLGAGAGGVAGTLQWLRAQAGKPYIWASAGPEGYDCSGLISATWRLLHGLSPYVHQFSTMDEAPYFPKSGYGGPLTVGWTNPGERGPGGDSVGHTAGILAGLPFESVGGQGVRIGAGVTPISSFAHVGHYDSGGPLPPGLTIAYNGTGQNEQVYTADDHARAQSALAGGGDGRLFRDLNVHGSDGMSVDELVHRVLGEIAWQMR